MEESIIGIGDLPERIIKLKESLQNHQREIESIIRKIDDPRISDDKKHKLIFRYFEIVNKVIPKINSSLP